jgi:hypothetical protein
VSIDAEAIATIAGAAVAVISAVAAGVVKILAEIRTSRDASGERHALTRERLTTIEGAAAGAQAEAGTANARIAELERQLAEERAKREVR